MGFIHYSKNQNPLFRSWQTNKKFHHPAHDYLIILHYDAFNTDITTFITGTGHEFGKKFTKRTTLHFIVAYATDSVTENSDFT